MTEPGGDEPPDVNSLLIVLIKITTYLLQNQSEAKFNWMNVVGYVEG